MTNVSASAQVTTAVLMMAVSVTLTLTITGRVRVMLVWGVMVTLLATMGILKAVVARTAAG